MIPEIDVSALFADAEQSGAHPGAEAGAAFAPLQFGDHLWATTTKFPENYGLGHLRPARAPYQDPFASD